MRKVVVLLLILLVIGLGFFSFIIPASISIKEENRIAVNSKAFTRVFLHEGPDFSWLAVGRRSALPAGSFTYKGNDYFLLEKRATSLLYSIRHENDSLVAELVIIPFSSDSVALSFIGSTKTGWNPVSRLQKGRWAKQVAADMKTLLQTLRSFYADEKNIYGFTIQRELVVDTALVSTSERSKGQPSITNIYGMIDRLKSFAQKNNAAPTGLPMVNVTTTADSLYLTRVALPLNKRLKSEGDIQSKWMMGNGNILATEVKGGPSRIQQAFTALEHYTSDHQWATAAIPFQSLVTDRRNEPDTNKWVTKVFWPVM
ncbi:hypothetical protein [Flavisolibacter nicotianae]|uniref:hypothetical protein n=1 Tax=Flavisolibacter nicotianae TaxID=2364882 RepID=UPI0013C43E60|nr:hypothetical protein [Flavisolibacter nicotianae]